MPQTETPQAAYSNKDQVAAPVERAAARLQRLLGETIALREQLAAERDRNARHKLWIDELETLLESGLKAVRTIKEELS